MKTFQTQCTDCRHVFTISDSQLAFKNGLARCEHCKKVFSAKDNLVTPMPLSDTQKVALAQLKQQHIQSAQNPSQNQFQEAPSLIDPFINSTTVSETALTKKQKLTLSIVVIVVLVVKPYILVLMRLRRNVLIG